MVGTDRHNPITADPGRGCTTVAIGVPPVGSAEYGTCCDEGLFGRIALKPAANSPKNPFTAHTAKRTSTTAPIKTTQVNHTLQNMPLNRLMGGSRRVPDSQAARLVIGAGTSALSRR